MGIAAGVIGTLVLVVLFLHVLGVFEPKGSLTGTYREAAWEILGLFLMFFSIWMTFPLAWFNGHFADVTWIVFLGLGFLLFKVSDTIKSENYYQKRRRY